MTIPYGRQSISQADIDAVVDVLRSDFLTQGPAVPRFEEAVASYCGAAHALAMNSATSALHVACLALDLRPGGLLWTSPLTFVASSNCALYCGADVDFVDVDPATNNLCPRALEHKLVEAEQAGRLPDIVVPVHLTGEPCDMRAIHALAQRFGFRIIEDASHAIGGRYLDAPVGSCRYSDVTVFSFHPVKIVTTAEGGMALTNDSALAARMQLLRSHGITRDPALMTAADGPWYYEQLELGYNYRMTDLQAALGTSQVQQLDAFVAKRHEIARRYDRLLADLPLTLPVRSADSRSALHLYVVRLVLDAIGGRSHRQVFEALRAAGIGVNLHYIPVYRQPYYRRLGFDAGYCTAAEQYYREALSLPIYVGLTDDEQNRVVDALRDILR